MVTHDITGKEVILSVEQIEIVHDVARGFTFWKGKTRLVLTEEQKGQALSYHGRANVYSNGIPSPVNLSELINIYM